MKLVVMRHGDARASRGSDAQRELTAQGCMEVDRTAEALREAFEPTVIAASPLVRAQQSAERVCRVLGSAPFETWQELTPSASCGRVCEKIKNVACDRLLLISHQPFVTDFVEYLTGEFVMMRTGVAVMIELSHVEARWGEVAWLSDI